MAQKILIADDERLIREMLAKALTKYGYEVSTAENGQDALDQVGTFGPDLLLLDLMMPHVDGFEVLQRLRAEEATRGLQVIVLTARAGQDTLKEALDAGADDYISKPFHLGEVAARVNAHLRIAEYAEELHQKREDSQRLLDISHRLTSQLDLRAILQDVVNTVAKVLHTDRASIVLVEQSGVEGRIVAASDDEGVIDRRIALDGYPEIRRVLETHQPLVIADITADPLFDPVKDQIEKLDVRSAALFPMLEGERCLGVLFLRSTRAQSAFREREVRFGEIVANATAVAVTNARHVSEIKEESDRIDRARAVVEQRLRIVQRYEDFFENSADGMLVADDSGTILFMNRQAESITGVDRALGRGLGVRDLIASDDRGRVKEVYERARGGGPAEPQDFRLNNPEDRVVSVAAARMPGDDVVYSLTLRDVTRERAIAGELARTRDFLQGVIDASLDAIVATDRDGRIVVFNTSAERLFEMPAGNVVNKAHVRSFFPPGGAAEVMAALHGEEDGGRGRLYPPVRREVIARDGTPIPVLLSASVVEVEGQAPATLLILADQRNVVRMENQLFQTRERLEQSERQALLAALAGTAAHELNQPLTSVMGYAELLKRRVPEGDPNFKAADTIHRECARMADIVKKIGRITRYETKTYVGDTQILDLNASADDSVET